MKQRTRPGFSPLQAQRVNQAFRAAGVDYLFIGKSGAILLGYPSTTQDVDLFVPKSEANGRKIVRALRKLGFTIGAPLRQAILGARTACPRVARRLQRRRADRLSAFRRLAAGPKILERNGIGGAVLS